MRQLDSLRRNAAKFNNALEIAAAEFSQEATESVGFEAAAVDPGRALETLRLGSSMEGLTEGVEIRAFGVLEAIVLDRMRPPYFILCDKIEIKGEYDHVNLIENNRDMLETTARSVGRVDLINHRTLSYAGTGWLVAEDIAVTNRHVAEVFGKQDWAGRFGFRQGAFEAEMEARLNYVRQHEDCEVRRRADVTEILYIAGPNEPDIAFLRVKPEAGLVPLELETKRAEPDQPVAAIGYPASDGGRNDPALMEKLFGGIYDVKRFSPGMVTDHEENGIIVLSDYTSLGGNSGSPVIDLNTGKAVALHFAGAFRDANYAVAADIVAAALARQRTAIMVPDLPVEAPVSAAAAFADRNGYNPDFLGDGNLSVALPGFGPWSNDLAAVSDDSGNALKYRNFSVIQCASRRLPLLTAVNIDGAAAFALKRKGSWKLDGRIAPEHQIGNELYRKNPLDRGHMVRRRDPGWGETREIAQEAEIDTFHYTNSAPQHANLNQKDWVGLEDYILGAAETRDFKVTVFTGPVFRSDDRRLREQPGAEGVQIPEEFWKIAVMVHADTGGLSATGYILSHGTMIRDLVEAAFVLGQYDTYQVKIAKIERETGLNFGPLRAFDPLGGELEPESPFAQVVHRIGGPADLRL